MGLNNLENKSKPNTATPGAFQGSRKLLVNGWIQVDRTSEVNRIRTQKSHSKEQVATF